MTDIVTYKFIELLDEHKTAIPIDHPDRSVTRSKLEYPTEDVSLAYLDAINKATIGIFPGATGLLTADSFTDKKILGAVNSDSLADIATARWINGDNCYLNRIVPPNTSADFELYKLLDGTLYALASEAVDLPEDANWFVYIQASGSTISTGRSKANPLTDLFSYTTFSTISATDSDIASGKYGFIIFEMATTQGSGFSYLLAPTSHKPPALRIIETEITSDGDEVKTFKPDVLRDLKEALELQNVPDYVKREAKRYEILKKKGFTDEEIKLVLGYIPQHQVDLAGVTWGAFEFNPKHPTVIITVTGGNFYTGDDAITKQVEHVKSRGLRVLNPPSDYREAVEQYNMLKKDYPHWLAGKDNYAYQTLGWEVLELFQVADFYYGELVEHKTHYNQLKQVPDWELRRTIERWYSRLKQVNVLIEERDKHLKKLEEVLKLGW